jgi:hypothetical protein
MATDWVRFQAEHKDLSVACMVKAGYEAHPSYYPMGKADSFRADKVARVWSWSLTLIQCQGHKCLELYIHSLLCVHGTVLTNSVLFLFFCICLLKQVLCSVTCHFVCEFMRSSIAATNMIPFHNNPTSRKHVFTFTLLLTKWRQWTLNVGSNCFSCYLF